MPTRTRTKNKAIIRAGRAPLEAKNNNKNKQKLIVLSAYVASDSCLPIVPSLGLEPGKFVS
jgi:hypothetical protein